MATRRKLDLPLNKPVTIELLFDEPVTGTANTGTYNLYAVRIGDEEFSYFAPDNVHAELSNLHKGDKAQITKLAAQRGSKVVTSYEVKLLNKEVKQSATHEAEENHEEEDVSAAPHDNFFYTMLNSYRDALEISRELGNMIDAEKCAITLYISRTRQSNY